MGAVVRIHPTSSPEPGPRSDLMLSDTDRRRARAQGILAELVGARLTSSSMSAAIAETLLELEMGRHAETARALGRIPSAASLRRWTQAVRTHGPRVLARGYHGRQRKAYGWEARAARLYAQPQRPAYATVAYWLREEGFDSATNSRVRRYIQSLPSNAAETSRRRVGSHYYDQNIRPHVSRDTSVLAVGECYEGDGHTCDVYVAHPASGNPFRAELTVWGDVRSERITGWWLGEMENSFDVLYALSNAIRSVDHVPTLLHMDPGSGYVNRMLSDEALGCYARLSITPIKTLPGNARGKGFIEGWFRWFEERCGKRFDTFCGWCRTDDALSRLRYRIRRGELTLPSFAQYLDAVAGYMDCYNSTPKDSLGGKSPDEMWAALQRNPLHLPVEVLYRPRCERSVRGWQVALFNRRYRAAELAQYERRKVVVEYDIHDDSRVWIRDRQGRLVCEARLVEKKPWIEPSVLADRRRRAAEGQRKRLQQHLDEVNARARQPITAAALVDALEGAPESPSAGTTPGVSEHDALQFPPRRAQTPVPRAVTSHALELATELDQEDEIETAAERFTRARELQAATEIGEEDARWLAIYRSSAEYCAHQLLEEDADGDTSTSVF